MFVHYNSTNMVAGDEICEKVFGSFNQYADMLKEHFNQEYEVDFLITAS